MKKVLVPLVENEEGFDIQGARAPYIKKLTKYNLIPVFVSHLFSKRMIDTIYAETDGALFMGGADWDSKHYGKRKHKQTNPMEPNRDSLELYLLKKCLKDKKPLLAICRGCQGLAVASGGALLQHVPEHVTKEVHNTIKTYFELLKSKKHVICLDTESKAYKILKKEKILVNSAHHQSVASLGKNMKATAKSPEGIVEIIEHIDNNYFCFGVQSHPEIEENSFFEKLFAEFSKAVSVQK